MIALWLWACVGTVEDGAPLRFDTAPPLVDTSALDTGGLGPGTSDSGDLQGPRSLVLDGSDKVWPEATADNQHHATLVTTADRVLVTWDHGSPADTTACRVLACDVVALAPTSRRPSIAVVGDQIVVVHGVAGEVDFDVAVSWLRWCEGC